jgi:pimeloyl-ACP methyl ester carboxylesterase
MITTSIRATLRARGVLASARWFSAVAAMVACGSGSSATPSSHDLGDPRHDADAADASNSAVEVFEAGEGDTTVVFESGLGNDWTAWKQVVDEVAPRARVFAYSRPGYGQSEPSVEPRDPAHIVHDLRSLLATRGVKPPYVLVGHSFGGAYMELFAKAHPDEVAALVVVDPRHRDFTAACEKAGLDGCSIPAEIVASLPPVQVAEYEAFASAADEIRAAGAFGTYPVRVLTATSHGFPPELEALWVSMHRSLADEATNGEQRLFPGAGHVLQVERPNEVAEAISSAIEQ